MITAANRRDISDSATGFRVRPVARSCGFTLIEVVVSLVIVAVLVAIAGVGLVQIMKGYIFSQQNVETAQKVQVAMDRIIKELAACTSVSSSPAPTASAITITRPGPVTNSIAFSGGLVRISGTPLINNVAAFAMTYYQADGVTTTTTASEIRRVDISLTVIGADNQQSVFTNRVNILESYW